MPDRETFQRMIAAHPDDDGPRLVFADWLEEQGDTAYSEFIRLQIQRHRLPPDDQEGRARITAQLQDIEEPVTRGVRAALPRLGGVTWAVFQRGAVEWVLVEGAEAFLRHGEVIFETVPVRLLWFKGLGTDGAKAVARSPLLARVAELNVSSNQVGDDGLATLVMSPHVANLRKLYAGGNGLTADAATAIADSPHLGQATLLFLSGNQLGDAGAQALAASKRLPRVEEVFLAGNGLHEAGVAAVRRRWGERAWV